jgi:LPS sulfotransferase NodH
VRSIDLDQLGQSWLDFWAHAAARAVSVRRAADGSRFHDVRYAELAADPLREVARLYAAAGLELTVATRERMARWLDRGHDRRARHRYDLAQFGLDASTVGARFAAYQAL